MDEHEVARDPPFYGTTAMPGGHFLSSSMPGVPERKGKK
jgi:hypothetical protein